MIYSSEFSQCVCQPGFYLNQQNECIDENVIWLSAQTEDSQNNCTENYTLGFYVDNTNQTNAICGHLIYQGNDDYTNQDESYCQKDTTLTFSTLFKTCYQQIVTNPQDLNLEAAINLCNAQYAPGCYYIMNQCTMQNREACDYQTQLFGSSEQNVLNVVRWPENYRRYDANNVATWKNIINIRAVITKQDGTPIKTFLYDPEHFNLCQFYQTGNIETAQKYDPQTRINRYKTYRLAEMLRRSGKSYSASAFSNGYPSQFGNNYQNKCQYDPRLIKDEDIYYISFYTDNVDQNYQLKINVQGSNYSHLSIPLIRKQIVGQQTLVSTIKQLNFQFTSYYDGSVQAPQIDVEYNRYTLARQTQDPVFYSDITPRTYVNRIFKQFIIQSNMTSEVKIEYSIVKDNGRFRNLFLFLYCIIYVLISFVQQIIPRIQTFVGTGQILIQQLMIILYYIIDRVLYSLAQASWHYQVVSEICFLVDQQGTLMLLNDYKQSINQSSTMIFIYGIFLLIKNMCRLLGTYFKQFNIFQPYRLQAINHSTNYSERNLIYRSFYNLMIGNEKIVYILICLVTIITYSIGMLYYGQFQNIATNIMRLQDVSLTAPVWSLMIYILNIIYSLSKKLYLIFTDQCNLTNTDFIFFDSQQSAIFVKGEKNYIQQGAKEMSQQLINEAIGKKQPRGIQGIQQFRLITSVQDQQINDYYQALQTIYLSEKDAGSILAPQKGTKFILPDITPQFGQQYENKMIQLDQLQDNMLQAIQRKQINYKLKHSQYIPEYSQLVADTQLCGSQLANIASRNYQPVSFGLTGFFGSFSFDYLEYLMIFIGFVAQLNYIGAIISIFAIWFAQYLNKLSWKRLICQQACIHGSFLE